MELAIRIHNARGDSDISEAAKNKLRSIFRIIFICLALVFFAWAITIFVLADKNDKGEAFKGNCIDFDIIGACFLG